MKKLLLIITSVIAVCFILYNSFVPHMKASNISYEDEYYYNEDANLNEDGTFMSTNSAKEDTDTMIVPEQVDTVKDSTTVLVNKEYSLPADYVPADLVIPDVLFNINYYDEKKLMRQEAATSLEQLFQAAKDKGLTLYGISGYRSYARQEQIYNTNIRTKGEEYTNRYSAKPGFSEHQTGLVLDVSSAAIGNRLEPVFAYTPEGKWLEENAYKYGFIIRYPKDKENITGYSYEPWHLRYVGEKLAKHLHNNDLTLEEYYGYKPSESAPDYISYDNIVDVDESTDKKELSEPTPEEIEKVSHGQEDETDSEENASDKDNPKDGTADEAIIPDSENKNNSKNKSDSKNNNNSMNNDDTKNNGNSKNKDNSMNKDDSKNKDNPAGKENSSDKKPSKDTLPNTPSSPQEDKPDSTHPPNNTVPTDTPQTVPGGSEDSSTEPDILEEPPQSIPDINEETPDSADESLDKKNLDKDSSSGNLYPTGSNIAIPETYSD